MVPLARWINHCKGWSSQRWLETFTHACFAHVPRKWDGDHLLLIFVTCIIQICCAIVQLHVRDWKSLRDIDHGIGIRKWWVCVAIWCRFFRRAWDVGILAIMSSICWRNCWIGSSMMKYCCALACSPTGSIDVELHVDVKLNVDIDISIWIIIMHGDVVAHRSLEWSSV